MHLAPFVQPVRDRPIFKTAFVTLEMLAVPDGRDVGPGAAVQVRVVDRDTLLRLRVPVLVEQDGAVRVDHAELRADERPLAGWSSRLFLDAWGRRDRQSTSLNSRH